MSLDQLAVLPDAAAVEAAAAAFSDIGPAADSVVADLSGTWSRLAAPGVYESPESGPVLAAMHEPGVITGTLGEDAAAARTALETYASTLADLETRRQHLVDDLAAADAAQAAQAADPSAPLDPAASGSAAAGLATRVLLFNRAAEQADQDCADALGALVRFSGDQVADFVEAANAAVGAPAIGLGVGLVERWDQVKDVVVGEAQMYGYLRPDGDHAGPWARTAADGRIVPASVVPGDDVVPSRAGLPGEVGAGHRGGPSMISEAGKWGGRGLGAAGAVLTIGATYSDQYRRDQAAHPEWSEGERRASAGETAAYQGGGAAVGAWAGAAVGAQWGATVGTMIFPGAGTVIGGLAGGLIGGLIGGGVGQKMGEGLQDLVGDLFG